AVACLIITRTQVDYWVDEISLWQHALNIEDSPLARNGLGRALLHAGKVDESEKVFNAALETYPRFGTTRYNLALVLERKGEYEKAQQLLRPFADQARIASRNDEFIDAQFHMGRLAALLSRWDEAAEALREAIKRNDVIAELHAELGYVYAEQKRTDAARMEFARALELDANWTRTSIGYASKLATDPKPARGDGPLAILCAQEVCYAMEEKEPGPLDVLAAAYAQDGKFSQAVETAKKALPLCENSQSAELVPSIRERIDLYEKQKPFHRNENTE